MPRKSNKKAKSIDGTIKEMPFSELVQRVPDFRDLREKYAQVPAAERRQAAAWHYDQACTARMTAHSWKQLWLTDAEFSGELAALAIDPEYAPAILTAGSLEYQFGRIDEAMVLFLQLTTSVNGA